LNRDSAFFLTMKETDQEAVAIVVQRVARMCQHLKHLQKVEQSHRREARLKAPVQLYGVYMGLNKPHNALNDVKDVHDINKDWSQSINTIESLKHVKDALCCTAQPSCKTVETLKNMSVPRLEEIQDLIKQGALLQVHQKLVDLECSRDGLTYKQNCMGSGNMHNLTLIHGLQKHKGLSDELAKQLWVVLQKLLVTIPHDSTLLVYLGSLKGGGERGIDRSIPDQKEKTSFVPSSRSKNWKEKMFAILDRILTRIEDTQADTMESDKMWFVCHLEIISKNILDAKNLMVKCFSPYYEVFRNYLNMYHKALSTQIQELELEDLKANEILSLFWVLNTYPSTEMEGNVELGLEVDMNALEILLSPNMVSELLHMYMSTLTSNIIAWLWKALETDRKDQVEETEPGADQSEYHHSTVTILQMFEQILQVAAQMCEDLKTRVLVCVFKKYKDEVQLYKEEHLRNWQDIKQLPESSPFKKAVIKNEMQEGVSLSNHTWMVFDTIAKEGCSSLLEELLDLKQHLNEQKPKKWLLGSNAIDIICVTMEEYFNDFAKIKIPYKKRMMVVVVEYPRVLMQKHISFFVLKEQTDGAERIKKAEHLFQKLASGFGKDTDWYGDKIITISEVIKLDPFVPYLEDLTLVSKSPDIRDDHVSMLLAMPGNASWNTKQTIIELDQGPKQANPNDVPISKEIVLNLNMAKILK
uniref:Exocyst complex component Sec6 n=1 Tax=Myotis lucifugus TaxID=59463 RepID=G1QG73_MYOLU